MRRTSCYVKNSVLLAWGQAAITKTTIVYIINTATVTSKIGTNYSNSLLLSNKNSKSTFRPIRILRHPAAGELRMCSFWAGGISSFPFSRAREYRLLRRLVFYKKCYRVVLLTKRTFFTIVFLQTILILYFALAWPFPIFGVYWKSSRHMLTTRSLEKV
jgi:hypothetical protein